MKPRMPRVALAAAVITVAAALSGCGSDGSNDSDPPQSSDVPSGSVSESAADAPADSSSPASTTEPTGSGAPAGNCEVEGETSGRVSVGIAGGTAESVIEKTSFTYTTYRWTGSDGSSLSLATEGTAPVASFFDAEGNEFDTADSQGLKATLEGTSASIDADFVPFGGGQDGPVHVVATFTCQQPDSPQ